MAWYVFNYIYNILNIISVEWESIINMLKIDIDKYLQIRPQYDFNRILQRKYE